MNRSALASSRPRVLVTTDINIDRGDPDDRQSMAHLLMYADELDIRGLIAERFDAEGVEATLAVIDAYERDFQDPATRYRASGFPLPDHFRKILPHNPEAARDYLLREARAASPDDPLYVLIWGNMHVLKSALFQEPAIAANLRVVSIGTNIRCPSQSDSVQPNWNGPGRAEVFADPRFYDMWWLEIDWTYEGMFHGPEPKEVLHRLAEYGALGRHIWEVVESQPWAHYFRVGDTPSVLYMIDPDNNLNDPTQGSWAGAFCRPFPKTRPHFFTDIAGGLEWDYENPINTWHNAQALLRVCTQTLLNKRPQMYKALFQKLDFLYGR